MKGIVQNIQGLNCIDILWSGWMKYMMDDGAKMKGFVIIGYVFDVLFGRYFLLQDFVYDYFY
jgi:hypothetical protein